MGFPLIFAGIVLIVSAFRGTNQDLYDLVAGDFTGTNNFIGWVFAIVLIGSIGYIPKLKGVANTLLALVLIAIFLKKGTGVFANLGSTIKSITQ